MNAISELLPVRDLREHVSVEAYHLLPEKTPNGRRTELIRGIVIEKMPKSPLHKSIGTRLYRQVLTQLPPGFIAWKEDPLTFIDSEPEPDVSVVRGDWDDFNREHAQTAALVVEIAVSSVAKDRLLASLYAENGVTEYWIILAKEQAVEIYRRPEMGRYQEVRKCFIGETLDCISVPGLRVSLTQLLTGLT